MEEEVSYLEGVPYRVGASYLEVAFSFLKEVPFRVASSFLGEDLSWEDLSLAWVV